MKPCTLLLLVLSLSTFAQQSPHIHVDQFGYLPQMNKVAVISNPQSGFNAGESYTPGVLELRDAVSDNIVLQASPVAWNNGQTHAQSGDQGWWFDFSEIDDIGTYYIFDPSNNVASPEFEISASVYNDILKAAGRMFYYNRCNTEKLVEHAGANWTDGTSFDHAGQDFECRDIATPNDASSARELSGGWFDAGDFNKYVTFAYSAVHDLLWAYEHHFEAFGDDWDIPESGNGVPDILDELKYELDWLLKMNDAATGETLLKMGSANFSDNSSTPPSLNTDPRYYIGNCSSASVAVAGMFAHAARVFGAYGDDFNDPSASNYAAVLQNRALTTFAYAQNYQTTNGWDLTCDLGQVVAGDADWTEDEHNEGLLAAAVHLFDLTGDITYQNYIVANTAQTEQISNNFWGVYKQELNTALLHYTTLENADAALVNSITTSFSSDLTNNWNGYYGLDESDLYRSAMPDWSYHWGSNMPKANYGNINFLATHYDIVTGPEAFSLQAKVNEQIHYFHGLNPLGKVYLSNMYDFGGDNCVDEMYHQWFGHNSIYDHVFNSPNGPAPGFVVGGPNNSYSGSSPFLGNSEPMQKAYADFNDVASASWEITEPAIYYQAAYVRLIARFVDSRTTASALEAVSEAENLLSVFPNPASDLITVRADRVLHEVSIVNAMGQILVTKYVDGNNVDFDTAALLSGAYFVQAKGPNGLKIAVQKFVIH